MKNPSRWLAASAVLIAALPTAVSAHFKLLEPASWLIEDQRGDPQKAGPCGGTNTDYGKPSYIVNKATGGQRLHIKVLETIGAANYGRPDQADRQTVARGTLGRSGLSARWVR